MKAKPKRRRITDKYLNSLPLHKLLTLGLRDLKKQEEAKDSAVDMDCWINRNGKCRACLAGSVMRFSLRTRAKNDFEFFGSHPDSDWTDALNYLRRGWVGLALSKLGRFKPWGFCAHHLDREMTAYAHDRDAFWREITKLRDDLKAANL